MPFKSEKQRKFIYAKADEGEQWAKDYIRDAGGPHGGHADNPFPVKNTKQERFKARFKNL